MAMQQTTDYVRLAGSRDEALARYRELQDSEGATLHDEHAIARAMRDAWHEYLTYCGIDQVSPESRDNPNLGRY